MLDALQLYPSGSIYMWAQLPDYIAQQTLWFNRETGEVSFDRPVEDQPAIRVSLATSLVLCILHGIHCLPCCPSVK